MNYSSLAPQSELSRRAVVIHVAQSKSEPMSLDRQRLLFDIDMTALNTTVARVGGAEIPTTCTLL
jgi:hypothetical protein